MQCVRRPTGPSTMSSFPTKITHFSINQSKKHHPDASLSSHYYAKTTARTSSISLAYHTHPCIQAFLTPSHRLILLSNSPRSCVILYPQSTVASRNCKSNSSQHSSKTDSATHITLSVALAHLTSAPRYRTRLHTHLCTTCILV